MPVILYLGFFGLLIVLATTGSAAFLIYGIFTRGDNIDDVANFAYDLVSGISPEFQATLVVIGIWAVVSLPGFILLMNSMNTENQSMQLDEARKSKKEIAEVINAIKELQRINNNTNALLDKLSRDMKG